MGDIQIEVVTHTSELDGDIWKNETGSSYNLENVYI